MRVTAVRGHEIASDAFRDAASLAPTSLEQKVLFAKVCGEMIAAHEDLGALALAIAHRREGGILRNYLTYAPADIRRLFVAFNTMESIRTLLDLPNDETLAARLSQENRSVLEQSLNELGRAFKLAAENYLALDGKLVNTYNKIKHGFNLIQRIDLLISADSIDAEWRDQIHVLTGIRRDGRINFTSIERSVEMLESLINATKMCGLAWKEMASLVVWLIDHEVPLSDDGANVSAPTA